MEEIKIHEWEKLDLRGATVIDGFPSVGAVSTIIASYIIDTCGLRQIGILDSEFFPPVAIIKNSEPLSPVRIYAGKKFTEADIAEARYGDEKEIRKLILKEISKDEYGEQLVVFISEFKPHPRLVRPIAESIIRWSLDKRCDLLISPEGLVFEGANVKDVELEILGVASTKRTKELLRKENIKHLKNGAISGVTGVLLNLGRMRGFDVVSLGAYANPDYPDARAAARIIEAINKLLLRIDVDPEPLYKKAEQIENQIKLVHTSVSQPEAEEPIVSMYG